MADKKYLNGIIVKEKQLSFGPLLTASIKVADFIKELQENQDGNGWLNINIKQRKSPSEKGMTHSVEIDTWKPTQATSTASAFGSGDTDDTLPF